jgi:hypothetical protein
VRLRWASRDTDLAQVNTRYYRDSSASSLKVAHFNERELDLGVNLRDLIDQRWESFDEILKPLAWSKHKFHLVCHGREASQKLAFRTV